MGEATLEAGLVFLRGITDFEMHLVVAIPPISNTSRNSYTLIDSRYRGTAMGFRIGLAEDLRPEITVGGLQGSSCVLRADQIVDWSQPRHIRIRVGIEDDLHTRLNLTIDGKKAGDATIDEPLFILADPKQYNTLVNKSHDGPVQQFSFGLSQFGMFGRLLDGSDAAKLGAFLARSASDLDTPIRLFHPGSYARAPEGRDLPEVEHGTTELKAPRDVLTSTDDEA
jgi:hypothetical protein